MIEFVEIAEYCNGWLNHVRKHCEGIREIDTIWPGGKDAHAVAEFLQARNFHNRASIEAAVSRHLMDGATLGLDSETLLFLTLRLECAIFTLSCWNQSLKGRGTLHQSSTVPEEAMAWALTGLWDTNCYMFLARAARAYCAGLDSALVPSIPGSSDPPWMDSRLKR